MTEKKLEELIADIDRETGYPVTGSGKIAPLSGKSGDYGRNQYIRFFLEDILLAIPISGALEISHRPPVTPLPNLPDWVMGVSNIRGEIISVVDLKTFFGLVSLESKGHQPVSKMLIIVRDKEMKVGMIVGRIMGIFSPDRMNAEIIRENPYREGEIASYISGVMVPKGKQDEVLMNILDIDRLLASPKMNAFRIEN